MSGVTRSARVPSNDPAVVVVLSLARLLLGLLLGVAIGLGARRAARVQCTSTLRIEPVGPDTWTLVCEGGR